MARSRVRRRRRNAQLVDITRQWKRDRYSIEMIELRRLIREMVRVWKEALAAF